MAFTDATRHALLAWLDSPDARAARAAIESSGSSADAVREWLNELTEEPASGARIVSLVADARARGAVADGSVAIERWLLVRQGLDALDSPLMARLGESARRLTCDEIATFVHDGDDANPMLAATSVRFREFAKIVTGRRCSAGFFHWEECGIRRSWFARVPSRDWVGFGRALLKMGGLGPMMFPHLNPRRSSVQLDEHAIRASLAVFAESIERRPDLRGLAAASWLRSPDTHRVSPRLAMVNAPILEHGGFVTTVGRAPEDCGVFARSVTRKRLYEEGTFTPTIGLVLWPRAEMLSWLRSNRALVAA